MLLAGLETGTWFRPTLARQQLDCRAMTSLLWKHRMMSSIPTVEYVSE